MMAAQQLPLPVESLGPPDCEPLTAESQTSLEMGRWREPVFKGVKIQFDPAAYTFSSVMCF